MLIKYKMHFAFLFQRKGLFIRVNANRARNEARILPRARNDNGLPTTKNTF